MHAGAAGVVGVEPLDPGLGGAQQVRLLGDDENAVHPRHRLELDVALAHAAFAGIENLLQLGDDRLGIAVLDREDADRLPAHPVDVEAERGLHDGAPLRTGALDEQEVAPGIGAHHAGPHRERVEQLDEGAAGHVAQRQHGDAVAGLGMAGDGVGVAAADRVAHRNDAIARGVADQHDVAHAQRVFEHEQEVGLRHRLAGRQADRSLHARVDRIADAHDVAEHRLGDLGDRRVLEVELVALAATGADAAPAAHRCHRAGGVARRQRAGVDHRLRALGIVRPVVDRLRRARQNVERADAIEYVGCFRVFGCDRQVRAGAERCRERQRPQRRARSRSKRSLHVKDLTVPCHVPTPAPCMPALWRRQQPDQQDGRSRKGQRSVSLCNSRRPHTPTARSNYPQTGYARRPVSFMSSESFSRRESCPLIVATSVSALSYRKCGGKSMMSCRGEGAAR